MSYIQEVLEEIKAEDGQHITKDHLFREWLNYEGLIGYDHQIKSVIKEIYGIDLKG
ncbi:hypothetical protein [Bacillus infantis]|uniref:hypothetical protein n=1 Tax=Bacillus infantis TaxID=324767 RepID=UPI003CFA9CF8